MPTNFCMRPLSLAGLLGRWNGGHCAWQSAQRRQDASSVTVPQAGCPISELAKDLPRDNFAAFVQHLSMP